MMRKNIGIYGSTKTPEFAAIRNPRVCAGIRARVRARAGENQGLKFFGVLYLGRCGRGGGPGADLGLIGHHLVADW